MDTKSENMIPLFEEIKIQTQILLPVLSELRGELGKSKADALVARALSTHIRSVYLNLGTDKSGSPHEKWVKVWDELRPRIGNNVERNFTKDDEEGRDYNVTKCKFAEYFNELGEPGLGKLLMCDFDYYIAEIGAPEVELTRTQTIMEGADHCDFCYRFNKK